jgi:peptide/bleomycin uptake transporter
MPYVIIATLTTFFASHWVFRWREAMTFGYLDSWRACKIDIEGSSQRMQEDVYRFAKITETLGLQILKAIMILIAFIPVLWELSSGVDVPYLKDIPGSLVWVALAVSVGGLIVSWFVGIKLPKLEYNIQKSEAAFRKELVYAEDDKINYASNESVISLFSGVRFNFYRLFLHYGYFNIWLISFSQFMVIVPFIIMGGGLFSGVITLGILIQVSNAFDQVRSSFSVFIDNWTTITELRSIHKRLDEFEKNIKFN